MAQVGGNRISPEAVVQARERERQVLQLFLRGLSWMEIGRQVGFHESAARKAFDRALKRIPPKDVEKLRIMQAERLNDARRRVYTELAGRQEPDPANPGQMRMVRPSTDEVYTGIDRILRIEIREANLYGLDAPKKSDIVASITGQATSDEILDEQLARLTPAERETFLMLVQKMQGRWVEPAAITDQGETIETTATPIPNERGGSA